jgi:hypothetical protein
MLTMNYHKILLPLFLIISTVFITNAQSKVVFGETFGKNDLQKKWLTVNGEWEIKDHTIHGSSDVNWAILLCNKTIPENYILTFSSLVEPESDLFEVILNLNGSKFLGIMLNQLENRVAIEDRSLLANLDKRGSFIQSTGHIGTMPKVDRPRVHTWQNWKIQRAGNQFFVWINDEDIISFTDTQNFVKPGGFTVSGKASVKDIKILKVKGEDVLASKFFKGKPPVKKPVFHFE